MDAVRSDRHLRQLAGFNVRAHVRAFNDRHLVRASLQLEALQAAESL